MQSSESKSEEPAKARFEKIPALKPAFDKDGTITAANASKLNDGAAVMLITSEENADHSAYQGTGVWNCDFTIVAELGQYLCGQVDQRRCRHLGMRTHYLRQQCHAGLLQLEYVPSAQQRGDIFTKCLYKPQHENLRSTLKVMPLMIFVLLILLANFMPLNVLHR